MLKPDQDFFKISHYLVHLMQRLDAENSNKFSRDKDFHFNRRPVVHLIHVNTYYEMHTWQIGKIEEEPLQKSFNRQNWVWTTFLNMAMRWV